MKVVFAGPSLYRARRSSGNIEFRAPAFHGDVHEAVRGGANVIGIVDGFFESVTSVWHKEILHALSLGVKVFGASSMGALRAAECAEFGMVGIGEIYAAYVDGRLVDDDAVALVHAPPELAYMPLSVPLVNVMWTLDNWRARGLCTDREADLLLVAAKATFFKERTWQSMVEDSGFDEERARYLISLAKTQTTDRKAMDAEILVDQVELAPDERAGPPGWIFSRTDQFERLVVAARRNERSM